MRMDQLTVGELAERTGMTRRAIRLYEQAGLITSERGPNGYRLYTERHVDEVLFIKALRAIGAPLKELAEFYRIKRSGLPGPEKHRQFLAQIDQEIERLLKQREAIDSALAQLDDYRQGLMTKLTDEGSPDCVSPAEHDDDEMAIMPGKGSKT